MPLSRYAWKNAASTSSREKPQVIWVRSLVPKEKNSADWAISPAVSAARGTSIIVPISGFTSRSEEHTSELQSRQYLVCRLLLEKKKTFQPHNSSLFLP